MPPPPLPAGYGSSLPSGQTDQSLASSYPPVTQPQQYAGGWDDDDEWDDDDDDASTVNQVIPRI